VRSYKRSRNAVSTAAWSCLAHSAINSAQSVSDVGRTLRSWVSNGAVEFESVSRASLICVAILLKMTGRYMGQWVGSNHEALKTYLHAKA